MTVISGNRLKPTERPRSASEDLARGIGHAETWITLGLFDIRQRYRRSAIGPFWIVLSTAAIAGGIGFMMSTIQGRPIANVIGYIVIGIMIWQFISTSLSEACMALIGRSVYIRSLAQPISTHIFRTVWVQLLIFCHTLVLYPFIVLLTGLPITPALLLVVPGLLLLLANVAWMSVVLSILSARYRDIPMVVGNVMSFLMFLTPVFWQAGDSTHRLAPIEYNPLYWLIQIVREPMLGNPPMLTHWLGALLLAVLGWGAAVMIFNRTYKRLALWV